MTLGTFYNYNHHNPETNPLLCLERGSSSTGHYGSGGSERSQIGREMDQSLAESKGNQEICPSFKVGPCTLLREKEAPTHLRSDVSSATCRKNDAGVDLGLGLNPHENRYNTRSSALSIFTSERGQAKKCHLTGNGVDMHKAKKKKRQDKMPITSMLSIIVDHFCVIFDYLSFLSS